MGEDAPILEARRFTIDGSVRRQEHLAGDPAACGEEGVERGAVVLREVGQGRKRSDIEVLVEREVEVAIGEQGIAGHGSVLSVLTAPRLERRRRPLMGALNGATLINVHDA